MLRTHRGAVVATGFMLLLGLSACGEGPKEPVVASAESPAAPTAVSSADVLTQYVDAQRRWVGCMRQQGHNVPDPDAKGSVDLGAYLAGAKIDKTDPSLLAADKKCFSLQPTVPAELDPETPLTPEQLANRRKYSKCMRENGMPQWPDPGPDGQYPEGALGGELSKDEQDANEKALQICDPVLGGKPQTTYDPNKKAQG